MFSNSYASDVALTRPQHSQCPFANLTFFRILFLLTFQYLKRRSEDSPAGSLLELRKCAQKAFPRVYQQAGASVTGQILRLHGASALEVCSESSHTDSVLFSTPRGDRRALLQNVYRGWGERGVWAFIPHLLQISRRRFC